MKSKMVKIGFVFPLLLPLIAQAAPPWLKITPQQAKAAAVQNISGKATSVKYEFEDRHWLYAVLVQTKSGLCEVEVSSTTGQVTTSEKTSPVEESKEAAADKKAAGK